MSRILKGVIIMNCLIIDKVYAGIAEEFIRASALVFGEQKEMEAYGLELGCDVDGNR